jgi:PPK2 family polyphosphate:nucleotide phosphotransferase
MTHQSMRAALAVAPGPVELAGYDPSARPLAGGVKNRDLATDNKLLRTLQERLYAESTTGGRRSLLLVLQGIDTAGKGGVTEHVVGAFGPIGVQYTAFKAPTKEEQAHDFLWRIRRQLPPAGVVGVFDRSHYEDVLVVRVHELVPESEWRPRYELLNEVEAELVAAGTTVLKCFLNISFDTQRKRLLARLDNPDKHWKFNEADIAERRRWNDYQAAYTDAIVACNTPESPWHVIPSDRKKYRNWLITELLREIFTELDPQYPRPDLDVSALKAQLVNGAGG